MTTCDDHGDVKIIDARHLACPLPVLKARKALLQMTIGQQVEVLATDPAAKRDFPEFARSSGNELVVATEDAQGVFRFVLRRG